MSEVTLYGYVTSPFVMKVGCYLKYKRIPFEYVHVSPVSPVQIKFTGQRQVPVLTIDGEWRKDSTPLGIWLDEVFPARPILGESLADTEQILAIDRWVSDQLIRGHFRMAVDWEGTWDALRNGWILARAVHDGTPLPSAVRVLWPFLVRRAGFIVSMVNQLDRSESTADMRTRLCAEFLEHLGDGPFLGQRATVSLADLSAYPIIVSPHLMGLHGESTYLGNRDVLAWCRRVQAHLSSNPLVVPDHLLRRPLP